MAWVHHNVLKIYRNQSYQGILNATAPFTAPITASREIVLDSQFTNNILIQSNLWITTSIYLTFSMQNVTRYNDS
jgi:hypothetical protein